MKPNTVYRHKTHVLPPTSGLEGVHPYVDDFDIVRTDLYPITATLIEVTEATTSTFGPEESWVWEVNSSYTSYVCAGRCNPLEFAMETSTGRVFGNDEVFENVHEFLRSEHLVGHLKYKGEL